MEFTTFVLKNLLLFPPVKKSHLIIAFCVNTHAIFSIYSPHICPRRAVCVCWTILALNWIHATTHQELPSLHPPNRP